ncbi:uncharacterized protein LOC125475495 isoform X2 [Pyrus x bretschneideri]|uniref:uncharacterized protein LOC125475495 isoform X2 n=1 Tax=Pyrus x bretschneideri TaxID=225117 RepID=UPI00202DE39C|nr:uncharacterized protein LOC125475495 isoform X2 [Pyrus x bretschneideri]
MTSTSAMNLNSVMSVEANIGCWDLRTGVKQLRYKLCASPPHGLICVGERFLASSQLRESSSSSGSVLALVQAASSCLELSKRTDQSACCEQRRHIDCWRRLVGEYLLVGGPVNNILVVQQHFSKKYCSDFN